MEFKRGEPVPLVAGTLLLLAPGCWHRCQPNAQTGWGTLWIGFNGEMASAIVHSIFHTNACVVKPLARAKEFKYTAMRLIAHALKNGESRPFTTIGDLASLLGHLADGDYYDCTPTDTHTDIIRKAQTIISSRHAEPIDFGEMAQSLGLTYDVFRHNFVKSTGLSPLQFQLAERLRTSKNLIANTNLPIMEVARRSGFSSNAYFTRFFKSETKMSPLEYRKAQSTQ